MKYIQKTILLFALIAISAELTAQHITQFRGPARDGIYNETNLLKEWPAGGPALFWKTEGIGNGYSSPVISGDRIFVTGEIDSTGYLFAFDKSGVLLWKKPTGREWMENFTGSRSTPTLVDGLIYVSTGMGRIICFDAGDGSEKWSVEMLKDLHGVNVRFGYAEGLLVNDNLVYCSPGGPDTNIVALNRFTGKIAWVSKALGDSTAFASPQLIILPSRKILVNFTIHNLVGLEAATGELLWSHHQVGEGDIQANTPLYENGFIYYVTGSGNGAVKLALSEDGRTISEVWRNEKISDVHGGFVKLGNYIYTSQYKPRRYCCLDASTGLVTDSLKFDKGAVIFADDMLYCYTEKGKVGLVKPSGGKMELVSSFRLPVGTKEFFTIPVISEGILYLRQGGDLLAYDIRKK
ncbi:MAG: PQQ-binding-like beta-propeller repeat protein [Bacteroidota bacterium]